jgi:hypothetical protein
VGAQRVIANVVDVGVVASAFGHSFSIHVVAFVHLQCHLLSCQMIADQITDQIATLLNDLTMCCNDLQVERRRRQLCDLGL